MKSFIKDLEQKLINSEATFKEFDEGLWFYLCEKQSAELKQLSKNLGVGGKYMTDTNIGNIRLEVIEKLGLNYML